MRGFLEIFYGWLDHRLQRCGQRLMNGGVWCLDKADVVRQLALKLKR